MQAFANALQKLSASCNLGDWVQTSLRNEFVYGPANPRFQSRLQEMKDVTFEKATYKGPRKSTQIQQEGSPNSMDLKNIQKVFQRSRPILTATGAVKKIIGKIRQSAK